MGQPWGLCITKVLLTLGKRLMYWISKFRLLYLPNLFRKFSSSIYDENVERHNSATPHKSLVM